MSKNKKAIIYTRVSSAKQNNKTTNKQIENCIAYANEHNIQVLEAFSDVGSSNKSFKQTIQLAVKQSVDYIILERLNRMPGGIEIALDSLNTVSKNGIEIISISEKFCSLEKNHPIRNLLIFTAMRDMEFQLKSKRIKNGIQEMKNNMK